MNISNYLNDLKLQQNRLIQTLSVKGITTTAGELLNSLIDKVASGLTNNEYRSAWGVVSSWRGMFSSSPATELPDYSEEMKPYTDFTYTYQSSKSLKTIKGVDLTNAVNAGTQYLNYTFYGCIALENVTFKGIIPMSIGFRNSTKLTPESVLSIYEALKDNPETGSTITIPTVVLDKFDSWSQGTYDEIRYLINEKGWTIVEV